MVTMNGEPGAPLKIARSLGLIETAEPVPSAAVFQFVLVGFQFPEPPTPGPPFGSQKRSTAGGTITLPATLKLSTRLVPPVAPGAASATSPHRTCACLVIRV